MSWPGRAAPRVSRRWRTWRGRAPGRWPAGVARPRMPSRPTRPTRPTPAAGRAGSWTQAPTRRQCITPMPTCWRAASATTPQPAGMPSTRTTGWPPRRRVRPSWTGPSETSSRPRARWPPPRPRPWRRTSGPARRSTPSPPPCRRRSSPRQRRGRRGRTRRRGHRPRRDRRRRHRHGHRRRIPVRPRWA